MKKILTAGILLAVGTYFQAAYAQVGATLSKPVPEKEFQQVKSTLSKLDPKSYLIKMKVIAADGSIRDEVLGMKSLAGLKKDQLSGGFLVNNAASGLFPGLGGNPAAPGGNNGMGAGLNNGGGKQGQPGQPGGNGGKQQNGFALPQPGTANQQGGGNTGSQGGFNTRVDQMGSGGNNRITRPGGMVMGKDGGDGGGKPDAGGGKTDAGGGTKTEGPKNTNTGSGGSGSSGGDRTPPNTSGGSGSSGGDRTPPNTAGGSGSGGADRTPPNRSGHNSGGFGVPVGNNVTPKGGGRGGNTQAGMPDPEGSTGSGEPSMVAGNTTVRANPAVNTGQRNPGVRNPGSQVTLPADFRTGSFFICDLCTQKNLGLSGMRQLEQFMQTYR